MVLPGMFSAVLGFFPLFLQINENQRYMMWAFTWYIWETSYFLAYSCESLVVERVNVVGKNFISINLSEGFRKESKKFQF